MAKKKRPPKRRYQTGGGLRKKKNFVGPLLPDEELGGEGVSPGLGAALTVGATLGSEIIDETGLGETTGGAAAKGAAKGAAAGAAFGPAGIAVGAGIGAIGNTALNLINKKKEEDAERLRRQEELNAQLKGAEFKEDFVAGFFKGGKVSRSKAKKILKDGTIRGKKITKKQKGFFGAIAGSEDELSFQDGGLIIGAGTGTSDSINASFDEGDFIIPADADSGIVSDLLTTMGLNKPAPLKKGDVDVKVSNQEAIIPTERVAEANGILQGMGLNSLDDLAPNATTGLNFQDGGEIDVLDVRIKETEDEIKSLEGKGDMESFVRREELRNLLDGLKAARKPIGDITKDIKDIPARQDAVRTALQNALEEAGSDVSADQVGIGVLALPEEQVTIATPTGQRKVTRPTLDANREPAILRERETVGGRTGTRSPTDEELRRAVEQERGIDPREPLGPPTEEEFFLDKPEALIPSPAADAAKRDIEEAGRTGTNKVDFGDAISLAQIGVGTIGLLQQGDPPVDVISDELSGIAGEIISRAGEGLSAEELSAERRRIESTRRNDIEAIKNLSGGDSGTALANMLQAGQKANQANLRLSALDEQLERQSLQQGFAAASAVDRRERQLFEDEQRRFERNESAVANLLTTGIENLFENQVVKKAEERDERRKELFGG